jgi:NADH-quinone oxidoreductase subunit G
VVLVSPATLERLGVAAGSTVTMRTDHGSVELPVAVADLADDVAWAPSSSEGIRLTRDLGAAAGSVVRLQGGHL